ncbi:phosphate acetyltransferase [Timonella senegalensis]|uniref:phosphate acetyltransferase n=1 Tax=Timonella senegalensis TaxID=1465825 RepID=UPI0028A900FB|nr:phosphate acetyltransferase [Timonella senegalensis]
MSSKTRSVYLTSPEGDSGKSTIALGVLDLLTRQVQRVGVFRPITRNGANNTKDDDVERDYVLELLLEHDGVELTYEQSVGVTYAEVHANPDEALAKIINRYHEVEQLCDAVVIVGSDYTDVVGPTELAFNARIAANLGAPVLLVLSGAGRTPEAIHQLFEVSAGELANNHASILGTVINRTKPGEEAVVKAAFESTHNPVWTVPEEPFLTAPTVRQLMKAVEGRLVNGDDTLLGREVLDVQVGAMNFEHLLGKLIDGAVVITPGDRVDVLLGLLTSQTAKSFPSLAGIILNGGFFPPESVSRLLDDIEPSVPIIQTDLGTFNTASNASRVRGRLSKESQRKVDTAMALFEQNIDGKALLEALEVERPEAAVTPLMFEYELLSRARENKKHIVLPEGTDDRILRAASTLLQRQVADITILGDEATIRARATELGLNIADATVLDTHSGEMFEEFAAEYARLRAHKGVTVERAREIVSSVSYFGTMMVQLGYADGMVSGAAHTTAHTIRPAFEVIKTTPDTSVVSSVFMMCLEDRVLVYGDCAVNPDPTAEQLADIAISSAETATQFGVAPRIAMLSYSTGDSGAGADVDKVRQATEIVRTRRPDLEVEGPIQYDAAVDASVAASKLPDSAVAGRATVFVFPDLNTGNNTYKAVQRSAGAVAVGPILQGLRKPVNDLSRGALVQDIVNTVAITAIQAQGIEAAALAAEAR